MSRVVQPRTHRRPLITRFAALMFAGVLVASCIGEVEDPEPTTDLIEDLEQLESTTDAQCDGAPIRVHCYNQEYGCGTCSPAANGAPRRRSNQYVKWCSCQNGQQVCGDCFFYTSWCSYC